MALCGFYYPVLFVSRTKFDASINLLMRIPLMMELKAFVLTLQVSRYFHLIYMTKISIFFRYLKLSLCSHE